MRQNALPSCQGVLFSIQEVEELSGVISELFIYSRVPPAQGVKAFKLLLLSCLFASDGCVKSGGGVFRTVCVCVGAEAKEEGVWSGVLMNRRTGLLLCSPNSRSFPSCFALPLTKLFMAFWFGARSLTHLPTCVWVCVWVKILTIDILLVVQFYFKQHAKLSLTFLACEKF